MDSVQPADRLHSEAIPLLDDGGMTALLSDYNKVCLTGSYALYAMVWPDIDIHVVMEPDPASLDAFFDMCGTTRRTECLRITCR